jgi:RES domain-containing protein
LDSDTCLRKDFQEKAGLELLMHVLDLTDRKVVGTIEMTHAELVCPWREMVLKGENVPTHALAEVAYKVPGLQAIRFPSNQDPAGVNLVIWTRKVKSPCYIEVEDPGGTLWQRVPRVRSR